MLKKNDLTTPSTSNKTKETAKTPESTETTPNTTPIVSNIPKSTPETKKITTFEKMTSVEMPDGISRYDIKKADGTSIGTFVEATSGALDFQT